MARFEIILPSKRSQGKSLSSRKFWRVKSLLAGLAITAAVIGFFIAALVLGSIIATLILLAVVIAFVAAIIKVVFRRVRR